MRQPAQLISKDHILQPYLLEQKKGYKLGITLFKRLLSVAIHNPMIQYCSMPNSKRTFIRSQRTQGSCIWLSFNWTASKTDRQPNFLEQITTAIGKLSCRGVPCAQNTKNEEKQCSAVQWVWSMLDWMGISSTAFIQSPFLSGCFLHTIQNFPVFQLFVKKITDISHTYNWLWSFKIFSATIKGTYKISAPPPQLLNWMSENYSECKKKP
jgi:hypothetical protein